MRFLLSFLTAVTVTVAVAACDDFGQMPTNGEQIALPGEHPASVSLAVPPDA